MTKEIPLTHGKTATVDDSDYERVRNHKWYALRGSRPAHDRPWYAACYHRGLQKTISLHVFLMNPPMGMTVDHVDGNGLNCTRANMRLCTQSQNNANRRAPKTNTSGYKGVCWSGSSWLSQIGFNKKRLYLGRFKDPVEAAKAYDKAARKIYGEFAKTNFTS